MKLSKIGLCLNRRYLVIRQGTISYFRNSPYALNFASQSSKSITMPKGQVLVRNCDFQKYSPSSFLKKKSEHFFEISFVSPSKTHKRIRWIFAVFSSEQLTNWLKVLEEEKKNDSMLNFKEKEEAQKLLDEEIAKEMRNRVLREESKKKITEYEKRKMKIKEKLLEEEKRKQEVEIEIKRLQEEAEVHRQEEIAEKKRMRYAKLLEYSWDYQFQKLWTQLLDKQISFEESLTYGIRLFKHIGVFTQKAIDACKIIINELAMPEISRQLHPIEYGECPKYTYQNMLIQLAFKSSTSATWKILGHEFRANNSLFNVLYKLGKQKKSFKVRVPLTCVVDFRGFRCFVMAIAPLDNERTLIHGPKSDGIYLGNPIVYDSLSLIAKEMRLKEHKFEWNEKIGPSYVHLSALTECHKSLGYRDLEEYMHESLGSDVPEYLSVKGDFYLLKVNSLFPVDYQDTQSTPNFVNRLRPEFMHAYKLPLNADSFINIHPDSLTEDALLTQACRFLTEKQVQIFLKDLDNLQILPIDSFSLTQAFHLYGINIRYLGLVLKLTRLPHVKSLITTEIVARTCKNIFFEHLAETNLELGVPEEESIERSDSDVDRRYFRTKSFTSSVFDNETKASFGFKKRPKNILAGLQIPGSTDPSNEIFFQISPINTTYIDNKFNECACDFFNVLFGKGKESSMFWEKILVPLACDLFSVTENDLHKSKVNFNAVLHSLCYHTGLLVNFNSETQICQAVDPFKPSDFSGISYKLKLYDLNAIEYKELAEKSTYFRSCKKISLALQSYELQLRISRALFKDNELGNPGVLAEIAEILLETQDIENAVQKCKESLVQIHPLHASSIRSWCVLAKALTQKKLSVEALSCFNSALFALQFHWGDSHPLLSNIYAYFADLNMQQDNFKEALTLYKTALLCCYKNLGPNHIQTAQIYLDLAKYYNLAGMNDDALIMSEKAYNCYTAYYGVDSLLAVACGGLYAEILFKMGRIENAMKIISNACVVYEKFLKGIDFHVIKDEKQEIVKKFYLIVIIGLKISVKLVNFQGIFQFCEKIFVIAIIHKQFNFKIIRKSLNYGLEAFLNLMPKSKKALILKNVLHFPKINSHEKKLIIQHFTSEGFAKKIQEAGGLRAYFEEVLKIAEKNETSSNDYVDYMSEIKVILDIN